ncbi:MAG TPA: JAB domain-containing protein [Allosphingosinicella sp.]|nr:JAB domain-containing protein [Allosphingosinicella sp.]
MLIATAQAAAGLLGPLFASWEGEVVAALHLGGGRRLLAVTVDEAGGRSEVELPVRSILQRALRLGALAIIVAHNHPSGDPDPSEADRAATRTLADAAAKVGIRLHDHLIFGGGEWRSFRALGLL